MSGTFILAFTGEMADIAIYRWKGSLTVNRTHFKYLKNILISRFYKQKFEIFSNSRSGAISQKLLIKSRNQNIFQIFKMKPIRC